MEPKFKRVLLKLSGEALAQGAAPGSIYNFELLSTICAKVSECTKMGVQVAIVVGAGNIYTNGHAIGYSKIANAKVVAIADINVCCFVKQHTIWIIMPVKTICV